MLTNLWSVFVLAESEEDWNAVFGDRASAGGNAQANFVTVLKPEGLLNGGKVPDSVDPTTCEQPALETSNIGDGYKKVKTPM